MASPQCENGHVRIADELYEAILTADFSKRELLVVLAVIRKTYGYRRTMDRVSSTQIAELTGLDDSHCRTTLRELRNRGVLLAGRAGEIGVQKDYDQWAGPKRPGPEQPGPKQPGPKQPGKPGQNGPENRAKTARTTNNRQTDSNPSPLPPPLGDPDQEAEQPTTPSPSPKPKRSTWTPPAHLNLDAWAEFEQHRREMNKPLSDLARTKAANQLQPLTPAEQQRCIDLSIQARWAGLFPEKVKLNGTANHRSPGNESRAERYARMQREAEERARASCRAEGLG